MKDIINAIGANVQECIALIEAGKNRRAFASYATGLEVAVLLFAILFVIVYNLSKKL